MNTDSIAFLPLDTGRFLIDKKYYTDMLKYDTLGQNTNERYIWKRNDVVLYGFGTDERYFFDVEYTRENFKNRYNYKNKNDYIINPVFDTKLHEQVNKLLKWIDNNVPIIPTHVTLVNSLSSVPPHRDAPLKQTEVYNKGLEPSNVKILLNVEDYDDSLYFTDDNKTIFLKSTNIPNDTNCFGWSENFYKHGAIKNVNTNRFLINIFGILNSNEYQKLLHRSIVKYKDKMIKW